MSILDTKVRREILSNKFRSFTIIMVVAISLAMMTGLRAAQPMVNATLDENLIKNNVADGRFTFSAPIQEGNVTSISGDASFIDEAKIDRIDGRIILPSKLTYKGEVFPAVIIGINYPNKVNELQIEQRSSDIKSNTDIFASNTSCLIETRFFGDLLGQKMVLDDKVTLDFGSDITGDYVVKGVAQDTDYLYVVDPASGMTLMGQMAVVWMDLSTLQNILFGGLPYINEVLFTVDDRLNKDMTNDASDKLLAKFDENNIDISSAQFTIYDETLDRVFFDADAGSIEKVGTIFGVIGIVICCVIIFNTLNRMVQSQKKSIGLFMAMGAEKKKILKHYIKTTMVLAIIGVVIGVPLGYGMAIGMMQMLTSVYSLHYLSIAASAIEFVNGSLIVLGISFLISVISAYPITKTTPRDAMSAVFNRITATGKGLLEKLFGWLPMFNKIRGYIPLREIFLRKKKTVVTVLALSTSMLILINSVAMVYNMQAQIDDNYNTFHQEDIKIVFQSPVAVDNITHFMNNDAKEKVEYFELYIDLYTKLTHEGEFLTWTELECYQKNSTLRNFNIIEGDIENKKALDEGKILLGNSIAGKYDIEINDEIEIGLIANYSVKVAGKVGELIDFNALWTIEAFHSSNVSAYFGMQSGYVNGILLKISEDTDVKDLRKFIEQHYELDKWEEAETAKNAVSTMMNTIMSMLIAFVLVGVLIGFTFSFSSMYISFIDRESDFLALKAMGAEKKHIRSIIFWENALLSLFSLIITIPLGSLMFRWSIEYMMGDKFYFPTTIPLVIWLMVFGLSLISIAFATRKLSKKIDNLDLANELRQRTIN